MKSDEILIKTFDQVKNDNFDQVKFDQVPKSVGSFLAVDQKFLNEFKLIELVLMANF